MLVRLAPPYCAREDAGMNEGVFRVLEALGHGRDVSRTELVRESGEAHSVITQLGKDKPKWFESAGEHFQISRIGLAALGRELYARKTPPMDDALLDAFRELVSGRPRVKRELDQVHATLPCVLRRARLLVESGEAQRGLIFFGDDDLTALAVGLVLDRRPGGEHDDKAIRVIDIDDEILAFYESHPRIQPMRHDLRDPLPRELQRKFGAVFTDPPYTTEGFALFLSRAVTALKPDGRVYAQLGHSRRARERGLHKQRVIAEIGLLVHAWHPHFGEYDGAESIGSRSDLAVLEMTPQTKPLSEDRFGDDVAYTRDAPED